jgi:hypothetical protein
MTMMTGKKYQGTNAKATKGGAEGRSNKAAEDDGGAREGVRREKVGGRDGKPWGEWRSSSERSTQQAAHQS